MKKDELQKLREKNVNDLLKDLKVNRDDLWQLKTDLAGGKVKTIGKIRKLKNRVAIINTIIKEKEEK